MLEIGFAHKSKKGPVEMVFMRRPLHVAAQVRDSTNLDHSRAAVFLLPHFTVELEPWSFSTGSPFHRPNALLLVIY